ncbi:MAG TPA: methyltransferase domain-containing protein [Pseudomonadales bacterium]
MQKLPDELFGRVDTSDDTLFYQMPRLVAHIDPGTIAALTRYYADVLPPGARVLDLMSSWISHLPDAARYASVAGLGMNAEELAANPRLDVRVVRDLNRDPRLPFDAASFDAALIAVSVQYLIRPVEVFRDIARVLSPGGRLIVAMSHRCFPTKAIRAFHQLSAGDRIRLVAAYIENSGGFAEPEFVDRSPESEDPLWIVTATTPKPLS